MLGLIVGKCVDVDVDVDVALGHKAAVVPAAA